MIITKHVFIYLFVIAYATSCIKDPTSTKESPQPQQTTIPHNPYPADGATNIDKNVTFFRECDSASSYQLLLGENNPLETIIALDIQTPTWTESWFEYRKTYYWQVIAKLNDGSTTRSDIWQYRTREVSTPRLIYPQYATNYTPSITFKWECEGAVAYDLYLDTEQLPITGQLSPATSQQTLFMLIIWIIIDNMSGP